jgi:hypothetical protein
VWFYCCIWACTELSAMWHPHQHHVIATGQPRHCHGTATSAPCGSHVIAKWQPRQQPIISTSDVASQSMTITFVTDFGLRAGFNGLYTNLWRLENVMDHTNLWRKFKDVTRRDPWRSIHDVLKFRHRCHFMTKFWWSVTKIDRHRPWDFL